MQIARHSLDFSVSSLQDDERRRDYRVEDRNSRELAHKRTHARRIPQPEQLPTDTEITA
nr:MAG TPA: hypothetical protein [Bacteriophage sp.]